MPWAAVAGAVIGGAIQSDSSRRAVNAQRDATNAGLGVQERQFNQQRADFAPWREAGATALGQLQTEMGRQPTAEEVMATPGYEFGRAQGQQGVDRRIAAMGGRVSGSAIKAASRFNTDYATSGYNAAYQRGQDRLNRLAAIAGLGQTATGASASAGGAATNRMSDLISSQGDANAANRISQGSIWSGTGNQLAAYYSRQQQRPPPSTGYDGYGAGTWSTDPYQDPYYQGP